MIKTTCPKCQNVKNFSDDKIGKKFKCPVCSEIILISDESNNGFENSLQKNKIDESSILVQPSATIPTESNDLHGENQKANNYNNTTNNVSQESTTTNWALIVLGVLGAVGLLSLIIWKVNSSIPNTNTTNNNDSTKTRNITTVDTTPIQVSTQPDTVKLITDSTVSNANQSQGGNSYTVSSEKAYFYSEASEGTLRKAYLEKDQQIMGTDELNGFIYTEFINSQGVKTVGWIKKEDLTESKSSN